MTTTTADNLRECVPHPADWIVVWPADEWGHSTVRSPLTRRRRRPFTSDLAQVAVASGQLAADRLSANSFAPVVIRLQEPKSERRPGSWCARPRGLRSPRERKRDNNDNNRRQDGANFSLNHSAPDHNLWSRAPPTIKRRRAPRESAHSHTAGANYHSPLAAAVGPQRFRSDVNRVVCIARRDWPEPLGQAYKSMPLDRQPWPE
jgi:hypothetical protein